MGLEPRMPESGLSFLQGRSHLCLMSKGLHPQTARSRRHTESSRNGRSLLPSPLARSSKVQAAADAPHGLQVCSGEGATGQQ